jgi:hypothetical protein
LRSNSTRGQARSHSNGVMRRSQRAETNTGASPRLGIEPVELRALDEGIEGCRPHATAVGSGKELVLAADGDAAERAFGGIVVERQATIVEAPEWLNKGVVLRCNEGCGGRPYPSEGPEQWCDPARPNKAM